MWRLAAARNGVLTPFDDPVNLAADEVGIERGQPVIKVLLPNVFEWSRFSRHKPVFLTALVTRTTKRMLQLREFHLR